jgi:maleate isomerase
VIPAGLAHRRLILSRVFEIRSRAKPSVQFLGTSSEKAVIELLATPGNRLDAVVQCGTNMSLMQVSERLEPVLGTPIIGINAALFWYALRENGFTDPLMGGGMLLREF